MDTGLAEAIVKHCATDGTHVYATDSNSDKVWKRLCSTGAAVTTYGTSGSGNGQFNIPWGIAYNALDTLLYVVDQGNSRIQGVTTSGVYVREWAISAGARGVSAGSYVSVAEHGSDVVKRYSTLGSFVDSFAQTDPSGIAVATGAVPWVSNAGDGTIAKWDEASTPGGYGQIAIEIDSVVSDYVGIGNRDGSVSNSATATVAGGSTVLIRAFAKATAATLTLKGLVLTARAVPQR